MTNTNHKSFAGLTNREYAKWKTIMGCDIHVYTERWEIDYKKSPKWVHCDVKALGRTGVYEAYSWYTERNYTLFTQIAKGVRGEFPWGLPCKGLPDDISSEVQKEYDKAYADWHSVSYMTLKDLTVFCTRIQMEAAASIDAKQALVDFHAGFLTFINQWMYWLKSRYWQGSSAHTLDENKWMEDIRIVYWFDN